MPPARSPCSSDKKTETSTRPRLQKLIYIPSQRYASRQLWTKALWPLHWEPRYFSHFRQISEGSPAEKYTVSVEQSTVEHCTSIKFSKCRQYFSACLINIESIPLIYHKPLERTTKSALNFIYHMPEFMKMIGVSYCFYQNIILKIRYL